MNPWNVTFSREGRDLGVAFQPSPSAGDLRELPRVPLRGEGSCGGGCTQLVLLVAVLWLLSRGHLKVWLGF